MSDSHPVGEAPPGTGTQLQQVRAPIPILPVPNFLAHIPASTLRNISLLPASAPRKRKAANPGDKNAKKKQQYSSRMSDHKLAAIMVQYYAQAVGGEANKKSMVDFCRENNLVRSTFGNRILFSGLGKLAKEKVAVNHVRVRKCLEEYFPHVLNMESIIAAETQSSLPATTTTTQAATASNKATGQPTRKLPTHANAGGSAAATNSVDWEQLLDPKQKKVSKERAQGEAIKVATKHRQQYLLSKFMKKLRPGSTTLSKPDKDLFLGLMADVESAYMEDVHVPLKTGETETFHVALSGLHASAVSRQTAKAVQQAVRQTQKKKQSGTTLVDI